MFRDRKFWMFTITEFVCSGLSKRHFLQMGVSLYPDIVETVKVSHARATRRTDSPILRQDRPPFLDVAARPLDDERSRLSATSLAPRRRRIKERCTEHRRLGAKFQRGEVPARTGRPAT
jgi:hypothetical protein